MESLPEKEPEHYNKADIESIDQALGLLDRAVRNNSAVVKQKVGNKFHNLKNIISNSEIEPNTEMKAYGSKLDATYKDYKKKALHVAKNASDRVDQSAHKNPWYFVGGAALVGSVLGFVLHSKVKRPLE